MKIKTVTAVAGVTLVAGGLLLLAVPKAGGAPAHLVAAPSATVVSSSPSASPSPSPSTVAPSPVNVPIPPATEAAPIRKPAPPARAAGPDVYNLYPVTAIGNQHVIDQGNLVTWMTSPTCLLAGHDDMGWAYLRDVPTGSIVNVHTGPCAGTYKIVGHNWQSTKGGPVPAWMSNYPLVLQSCTGAVGMGFSMAVRI